MEIEERIEEELSETVEGWSCMTDEERKNLRRARIDAELRYEYRSWNLPFFNIQISQCTTTTWSTLTLSRSENHQAADARLLHYQFIAGPGDCISVPGPLLSPFDG
ncbi:uncharacterized protein F5147DRAFT_697554 [Suillus discolor]|uniref:Uncharacterized protein n=1 Tax=Suillus discolor TaxID=1912936 RepID=A0A9P7F6W9_9AGAM|nr:uncharacterized protein F5147DRAFT_697554 [Suillus discolor]KAG2107483.1 hypothetical protein F5147DRAFT_697554 [Suillus discolor]